MQNASAPIPVVGVRPLVPDRLPDSTTGRRDLAHALGRFMMANNIPISKGLRDDLSIGYGKAIRYADEKIRKWENERAGNAPQTAQGGAQSTETPIDDRMLAQRGERAQNGSKAVRGKSAQKQGNKKAADKGGVVVTGDEFGTYENINELRGKALKYYKEHLQGTIVENALLGEINIDDVGIVEFTGSGKRELKNSSAKEEKLLLVRYLSELIRDATEISGKKSSKENHHGEYFYYLHTSAEINGQITPVEITLIKRNNGTIQYYNHTLPTLEKSKKDEGASVSTEPESLNEPSASPSIHAPSSPSTISPEEAESKENPLHEDEQTALKGLSADAKDVYRLVRDKLAGSSNKKVARAASVGAVPLARHADIIARKIRTAVGKPFTAMDYYRNMFALNTEGDKRGAKKRRRMRRFRISLSMVLCMTVRRIGSSADMILLPSLHQSSFAGQDYIGEVVVKRQPNRQRVYLHEVEITKKLESAFKTPTKGGAPQASRLIIAEHLGQVNACSKIVDENGEPPVVYHGSDAEFEVFDRTKGRSGMDIKKIHLKK